MRRLLPTLLLACAASACGGGSPATDAPSDETPETEPSWEGVEVSRRFSSRSFGEVTQLRRARLGPDAAAGLVVAGRSILASDAAGETLWRAEWNPDDEDGAFMGGLSVGLRLVDSNGDGVDDILAVNDYGEVHLVDGVDGGRSWSAQTDPTAPSVETVIFGDDAAPVVLPSFAAGTLDVATGERRWTLPLPALPVLATAGRSGPSASLLFTAVDRGSVGAADPDLFAIDGDGAVVFRTSSGGFALSLGAADLDGEGRQTLLAGATRGALIALEVDGGERFRIEHLLGGESDPDFTFVDRIAAQDLDGDGREEILFTLRDYHRPRLTQLVAVDGAGSELWRLPLGLHASILLPWSDGAGRGVFAALGDPSFGVPGHVLAIDTGLDTATVRWSRTFPWFVTALELSPDGATVLAGGMDGRIRAFDVHDGATKEGRALGQFSTAAVAVVGDRILLGDAAGEFTFVDGDGARLWSRTIELDGVGTAVAAIALGPVEDPTLVAVGVSPYSGGDPGTMQAFSAAGDTRFAVRTALVPSEAIAASSTEGERLVLTFSGELPSSDCRVMAHSPIDGARLWDRALAPCIWTSLAAADLDGDGSDEILISGYSYEYPAFVALVEADGTLRWLRQMDETPMWAAAGPGLLAVGGALGTEGFVTSLDPGTGAARWTATLPSLPDPADPRKRLRGHSFFGAVAAAPGGKRSAGVAAGTDCGQVFWISADDGAIGWTRTPETERVPASPRYTSGPLVLLPASATEPTAILATQVTPYLIRTVAIVYGLDGEARGSFELEGSVRGAGVGPRGSGGRVFGVATTLGATAFEIERP